MRYSLILLAAAGVAFGASNASAQVVAGGTADYPTLAYPVSFTAVVPPIISFTWNSQNFTFNQATDGDYTAGYMASITGPSFTHHANVPYKISAQAAAATLGFAPFGARTDTDPNKPIGNVTLYYTGATSGNFALSNSATDFYTRAARGTDLSTALTARMSLNLANDPPGTYTTNITFTMVAQ